MSAATTPPPEVPDLSLLEEVSTRLARMFDEPPLSTGTNGGTWIPAVNVEETKDELVLSAELPGMTEEGITIEMENNVLTISGEKNERIEKKKYESWIIAHQKLGLFPSYFFLVIIDILLVKQ